MGAILIVFSTTASVHHQQNRDWLINFMHSQSQSSRILLLLGGNGLGQLITIASMPILARLYDPADFGLLGGIMSTVSLSAVIVHGRYHMAIPVSRDEDEAVALLALATLLSAVLSPVTVVLFVFLIGRNMEEINVLLYAGIAIAITLATAMIEVFAYWRSHRLRFKVSARNAIARAGATSAAQIAFSPLSSSGLVGGSLAGTMVALALSIQDLVRVDGQRLAWPSLSRISDAARFHRGYPLFGVPQGLIASASWNALPFLLLQFSGVALAGQYWLAYRLLVAPVALLNGAYRQAILPTMGRGNRSATLWMARQHSVILLLLAAAIAAIIFLFGETLFVLLLGEKWRQAATMAAWLGIGITADVMKIPAMCLLQSRAGHRSILVWEALIAVARYGAALPYLSRGDVITAIAIFSLIGFVGWVSFSAYCLSGALGPEIGVPEEEN